MEDMRIPTMFKRDPQTRLVIPELADGCDWIFSSTKSRVSMMLDGYCFKIVMPPGEPWQFFKRQRVVQNQQIVTNWIPMDKQNPDHKVYWDAYYDAKIYREGIYELLGPDIKGNPHNVKENVLVGVIPADYKLCPAVAETCIRLYTNGTAEEVYKQIKTELSDPKCDVEGVVIQEEEWVQTKHVIHRMCKVKKRDFGIPWPAPKLIEEVKATVPATIVSNHQLLPGHMD